MSRTLANVIVVCGILATVGCSSEPGPTEKGGGFQLPPEAQKAQEEAAKTTPDQMMEKMKKGTKEGEASKGTSSPPGMPAMPKKP